MHVGGDDGALNGTVVAHLGRFFPLGRAVSNTGDDASQRGGVGAEDGAAPVVFEAGEGLCQAIEDGLTDELADRSVSLGARRNVEDTHAGNAHPARILVPVAKNLQRGADREERATRVEGSGETGGATELVGRERLGGVLAASERVDVQAVRNLLGQADMNDLGVDAAPAGTLGEDQSITAVAVGTQDLGHEDADSQRGGAHRVPSFRSSRTLKSRIAV